MNNSYIHAITIKFAPDVKEQSLVFVVGCLFAALAATAAIYFRGAYNDDNIIR